MLRRARLPLFLLVLASACATGASQETLDLAVHRYSDSLRWKRFSEAAAYLVPEARRAFLSRYLASEGDLHIDNLEVRGVSEVLAPLPTYDVTMIAEAYVLPSTVLSRIVMTQRWERGDNGWRIISSDRELLPTLAAR